MSIQKVTIKVINRKTPYSIERECSFPFPAIPPEIDLLSSVLVLKSIDIIMSV